MDAIESMDWGANAHFRFTGQQQPAIVRFFHNGYLPNGYLIAGIILVTIAILVLLLRGRKRAAQIAWFSFIGGASLLWVSHYFVPRRRPPDAQNILGPEQLLDSYPSDGVFICMLSLILLGFALWQPLGRPSLRALYCLIAALLTVWVCLTELFLCVRFVTDLIGAIVGAALIGWIACRLSVSANGKQSEPASTRSAP